MQHYTCLLVIHLHKHKGGGSTIGSTQLANSLSFNKQVSIFLTECANKRIIKVRGKKKGSIQITYIRVYDDHVSIHMNSPWEIAAFDNTHQELIIDGKLNVFAPKQLQTHRPQVFDKGPQVRKWSIMCCITSAPSECINVSFTCQASAMLRDVQ